MKISISKLSNFKEANKKLIIVQGSGTAFERPKKTISAYT
jgi:hypothetical protein